MCYVGVLYIEDRKGKKIVTLFTFNVKNGALLLYELTLT